MCSSQSRLPSAPEAAALSPASSSFNYAVSATACLIASLAALAVLPVERRQQWDVGIPELVQRGLRHGRYDLVANVRVRSCIPNAADHHSSIGTRVWFPKCGTVIGSVAEHICFQRHPCPPLRTLSSLNRPRRGRWRAPPRCRRTVPAACAPRSRTPARPRPRPRRCSRAPGSAAPAPGRT